MYNPGHTPGSPQWSPPSLLLREKGIGDEVFSFITALQKIVQYIPYKGAGIEVQGAGYKIFNQTYASLADAKKAIDSSYSIIQLSIK